MSGEKMPIDPKWEIIVQPIANIVEAQALIVDDAKRRMSSFDWSRYGVQCAEDHFDMLFPLVLNTLPRDFRRITMLDMDKGHEAELVRLTKEDHKVSLTDTNRFWLVMHNDVISPEDATFLRDFLWLQTPVAIAQVLHLPDWEVVQSFRDKSPHAREAVVRVLERAGQLDLIQIARQIEDSTSDTS